MSHLVPSSQCSNVIGKAGSTIKRIRSRTRADVKIVSKDVSDPSLTCAMDFEASAVAMASLDVIEEEKLVESSDEFKEGSKTLHDVLELDLPNLQKINSGKSTNSHLTECDRCGRSLYT